MGPVDALFAHPGLLAHQGGWDEILFVLAPLVLFAVLLGLARRRVDRMEAAETEGPRTDRDAGPAPATDDNRQA